MADRAGNLARAAACRAGFWPLHLDRAGGPMEGLFQGQLNRRLDVLSAATRLAATRASASTTEERIEDGAEVAGSAFRPEILIAVAACPASGRLASLLLFDLVGVLPTISVPVVLPSLLRLGEHFEGCRHFLEARLSRL